MTLKQWLKAAGVGARNRLHERTLLSLPAIARAVKGRASLATATKIHLAVGRLVPIESMTAESVVLAPPRKRARR